MGQSEVRIGLEARAAEACLSVTFVQRWPKSLTAAGAIVAEVVIVEPRNARVSMNIAVTIGPERERQNRIDTVVHRAQPEPMVQCGYDTGADFCLISTARDMEDFEEFTKRLFSKYEPSRF